MKMFRQAVAISTMALMLSAGAVAQDHHDNQRPQDHQDYQHQQDRNDHRDDHGNDHYVHHSDWRRGHRMPPQDWDRGERIDYRQYRLPPPRRGYEWRRVDGNYVMAAVATGLIASVIVAASTH